ncbi:MAG: hypothetical protein JSV09_14795 [Thermoplasmata archaeon]|nr:MAG: hypothetical protein JSV09_14795 [Thermoplasmata archaeon]
MAFDILLRSLTTAKQPSVSTIDNFRAPPEKLEKCRRYLVARGVEAHATDFGLACKAPRALFESLFKVSLKPIEHTGVGPRFEMVGQPNPPEEIAESIDQVTITATPEFF